MVSAGSDISSPYLYSLKKVSASLDHSINEASCNLDLSAIGPRTLSTFSRISGRICSTSTKASRPFPPVRTTLRWPLCVHVLRSEEHTSELQSRGHLVCRHPLENKKYN